MWPPPPSLRSGLVVLALLAACRGAAPDSPTPDDSVPLGPCEPALALEGGVVAPYGVLQLRATGGTGDHRFALEDGGVGGGVNSLTGAYAAPGAAGEDTLRLSDAGCIGEAFATVRVVEPLTLAPAEVSVPPGGRVAFEAAGGSGDAGCALALDQSGASLAGCVYTAGVGSGSDRVVLTDGQTGQLAYATVQVDPSAVFTVAGQGGLFLPLGSRYTPTPLAGSGVLELSASGAVSVEDGALVGGAAGAGSARVTDHYTGASVEVPVSVIAPLSFAAPRDGERSVTGVARRLGDVNGDGYPDAALAYIEPSVEAYYGGVVAIYAGSRYGLSPTPAQVIAGSRPEQTLGRDVAVGDLDRDGLPDLVVGSDRADRGEVNNGVVQIHAGQAGGFFSEAPTRVLQGELAYDRLGSAAAVCDFDGDGWLDLAAGAIDTTDLAVAVPADEQGGVAIFQGSAEGFPDLPNFTLYGQLPDEDGVFQGIPDLHLGGVLAAGDLDGDGLCDLVAGLPDANVDGPGEDGLVLVYRGTTDQGLLLNREPDAIFAGESGVAFGRRLAVADIDGDGAAELAVSAWGDDTRASNGGAALLFRGPRILEATAPLTTPDWSIHGVNSGDYLGSDLDLFDQDGDGVPELVVGLYRANTARLDAGRVQVYAGEDIARRLNGHDATGEEPLFEDAGEADSERLGQAVAALGDVDGDGRGDLLALSGYDEAYGIEVGAPYYLDGDGARVLLELPGEPSGHQVGEGFTFFSLAGETTLLFGAPSVGVEGVGANAGALVRGDGDQATTLLGGHATHSGSDRFGWKVVDAGDFNGDGYSDLAVLARKDSRPAALEGAANPGACEGFLSQVGAVLVYAGGPRGLEETPAFLAFGPGEEEFSSQLIGGFDHNGDGYADLAFGGAEWDGSAGGFTLVYGRPEDSAGTTIVCDGEQVFGADAFDFLGSSLAPLGDIDGDGCDELAVGSPGEQFDGDWYDQGAVRVLWGWGGPGCRSAREQTVLALRVVGAGAGSALAGGGDVDGDGLLDLVVGAASHRRALAEVGAFFFVPGWYLLGLPTVPFDGAHLADDFEEMLPTDGLDSAHGVIGTVAGSELGAAVALVPDPLDPTRALVAVGAPYGDAGASLAGSVELWRFEDGFGAAPTMIVVGETEAPAGELGETLWGGRVDGVPTLLVGAPRSDTPGGIDVGAVYRVEL